MDGAVGEHLKGSVQFSFSKNIKILKAALRFHGISTAAMYLKHSTLLYDHYYLTFGVL